MDVNEWMSFESSDEGTYTQNIPNSSIRSHPSEGENRSKNCKCKRAFMKFINSAILDKFGLLDVCCNTVCLICD
jgi:hypothetical protein